MDKTVNRRRGYIYTYRPRENIPLLKIRYRQRKNTKMRKAQHLHLHDTQAQICSSFAVNGSRT